MNLSMPWSIRHTIPLWPFLYKGEHGEFRTSNRVLNFFSRGSIILPTNVLFWKRGSSRMTSSIFLTLSALAKCVRMSRTSRGEGLWSFKSISHSLIGKEIDCRSNAMHIATVVAFLAKEVQDERDLIITILLETVNNSEGKNREIVSSEWKLLC